MRKNKIDVQAVGLLELIDEARLVSPFQPTGTFVSTVRALVEPALTVIVDPALTDRSVPAGINYDEDRLGALNEVLDSWPAEAQITPQGVLYVTTAGDPSDFDWSFYVVNRSNIDNPRIATAIEFRGGSTRDGAFNVVVARGTAADGAQIQGVAYDLGNGATSYNGPFNALPVPFFYSSPLLTTQTQCNAAAQTVLNRKTRQTYGRYDLEAVPLPVLVGGDMVMVAPTHSDSDNVLAVIEGMSLPYTPSDGSMQLTLRKVPYEFHG